MIAQQAYAGSIHPAEVVKYQRNFCLTAGSTASTPTVPAVTRCRTHGRHTHCEQISGCHETQQICKNCGSSDRLVAPTVRILNCCPTSNGLQSRERSVLAPSVVWVRTCRSSMLALLHAGAIYITLAWQLSTAWLNRLL